MSGKSITELVHRLRDGHSTAREDLATAVYERLGKLARKMLRDGSQVVRRWEQTDDLVQAAWFRIQKALDDPSVPIHDHVHFFRLAARHVRFELIDMYRRHTGPLAEAANHETSPPLGSLASELGLDADGERFAANSTGDPSRLAAWGEFHRLVDTLPDKQREIMDLLWYQGLKQAEAAELLGVDVKTVKRRWREVKILLAEQLDDQLMEL